MVPAIMMNATMHPVIYKQKDGEETTLNPGKMMPFAWDSLLKGM
jgi:hypothetical protein